MPASLRISLSRRAVPGLLCGQQHKRLQVELFRDLLQRTELLVRQTEREAGPAAF